MVTGLLHEPLRAITAFALCKVQRLISARIGVVPMMLLIDQHHADAERAGTNRRTWIGDQMPHRFQHEISSARQTPGVSFHQQYAELIAAKATGDIVLAGQESIDFNGGEVPGFVAGILDYPFINGVTHMEVAGNTVTAVRETDAGKETIAADFPVVIGGQNGLVEDAELKIPNMRGIMTARTKPLNVVEAEQTDSKIQVVGYTKPAERGAVKMIDKDNVGELVRLLHEEAKVI